MVAVKELFVTMVVLAAGDSAGRNVVLLDVRNKPIRISTQVLPLRFFATKETKHGAREMADGGSGK